jgi:BMFP domain-containing protein YqiC
VDLSGIDRNAGDIANIRDFVILLRRDQVALRDRVTALEASGAATAASVEGLEARVAALEAKPFLRSPARSP